MKITKIAMLLLLSLASLTTVGQNKQNPLVFGENRITLITPTLFRLETAKDGAFINEPTQFAHNRSALLSVDEFTVEKIGEDRYEIKTADLQMIYHNDGYPFGLHNLQVYYQLNGKKEKFTNRCIFRDNLGGPIETLDRVTGEIPMQRGLLSRDGWYIIDDERNDIIVDDWIKARNTKTHIQDQYCFVYGNDYKRALADLGAISGHVPMTRKYIHGVWYCRFWDYTAVEFEQIIDEYDQNDFPLDNLVFDMAWHTNDAAVGTGHSSNRSWTGYTWNKDLIPDPKGLIDKVHARGVTVSLNDHPHDGIRPHEDAYESFMEAMNADTAKPLLFDLSDKKYMDNFFKYALHPSEDMGIDFWWLDWQQNYLYPEVRGHRSSSLSWINELYYRNTERKGLRGAGYSRWSGWGDHRHPIQFSGDAQANWEILAFEVKLTAASGNAGCYYWAHDIGGFRGEQNHELTTRWTQFGALSAALRVHSTKDAKLDRRPWLSSERETEAMRRMYHFRSQLMPYVYSSIWQTHSTMVPLNRPMYIEYGSEQESYENPQEFLFGDLLLAAPITSAGVGEDKIASQKVWFPQGDVWYDYFTHQRVEGGQELSIEKPLEEFPLYVRGGWALPMQPYTTRPCSTPLSNLILRIYPTDRDVDNSYTLYEDDGLTLEYEDGIYATTQLDYKREGTATIITINPTKGSYTGQVKKRSYTIQLPAVEGLKSVKVNNRRVKTTYDEELKCYIVSVRETDIDNKVTITY